MSEIIEGILEGIDGDAEISEAAVFPRASFVASRRIGLAYRFGGGASPAGRWTGSAKELALGALSSDLAIASLGVAAINSLVEPEGGRIALQNGLELLREWAMGRRLALVGHFKFVEEIRPLVAKLWVLELNTGEGDLPASEAPNVIPQADVVGITGTTLINHTLEGLLELAQGKRIVILGPSTVMSPLLFDYGVEALCGVRVDDPAVTQGELSGGRRIRDLTGLTRITMLNN